jgi:hypothetical protein
MKQDWKVVPAGEVPHRSLPNLTAAWQICGKFFANRWRSPFSRNRAPPHCRHGFAARENCAICFATSLPQESSAQLMFDLAGFGDAA